MVSKKEVNDLWNEVYKSIDIDSLDLRDLTDALTLDSNTPKQMTDQVQNLDESLITPVKETEEPLTTADASKIPTQPTCSVPAISPISSSSNINYFNPSIISTPAKSGHDCNVSQSQQQNLSGDSFNSTLLSINESTATQYSYAYPYPMNANSFSQIESKSPILIPIMTCVTSIAGVSGVPVNNHQLPSSAMIMPSQSTITTLTSAMPSTVISSIQSNDNSQPLYLRRQIEAGPTPKRPGSRAKRSRFKSAIYNELENFNPNNFQPKVSERMYYFSAPNVVKYILNLFELLKLKLVEFFCSAHLSSGRKRFYHRTTEHFGHSTSNACSIGHAKLYANLCPSRVLRGSAESATIFGEYLDGLPEPDSIRLI